MVQAPLKTTPIKTLAQLAIQRIKELGCEYGEIRLCTYRRQNLWAQDLSLKRLSDNESSGFGIRVLWQGSWGFAASHRKTPQEIERVAQLAVEIAKGSHLSQREPVRLVPVPAYQDRYETPIELNPFDIPLTDKTELLLDVSSKLLAQDDIIKKAYAYLGFTQEDKLFASTEGSLIEQRIYRSGGGMGCSAVAKGDAQGRKFERSPLNKGYEHIQPDLFYANLERIAAEAIEKVHAPEVPNGKATLVLKPSHLWLPIHESVGHPTELDRVYGYEANFAGTSFATTEKLNNFQYAAPCVNFKADRTQTGGRSTLGYDDEGVKAEDWYVVKDGILVDYLTDRETAYRLGRESSNGCAYADNWASVPMVRIPNLGLEAGKEGGDRTATLDEMIANTKDGYLIDGDDTFSIDQQRRNFQFGGDAVWRIKDGQLAGMVKNLTYQSMTTDFWNSVTAIGTEAEREQRGTSFCGKGEPMQIAQMTHACPPIQVQNIRIGR